MTAKVQVRKRKVQGSYKLAFEKVVASKSKSKSFKASSTSTAISKAKRFWAVANKAGYTAKMTDCTKPVVKVTITGLKPKKAKKSK